MKENDVRANEDCTDGLTIIAQLQRMNPVTVPANFQLERVESDIKGTYARYHATKRAIEAFPGGMEAVALHLGRKPEKLAKLIEAMHDRSGNQSLSANDLHEIVLLTGDITPYLTLTEGLGIGFVKIPQLEVSKCDLPSLRGQMKRVQALSLFLEGLIQEGVTPEVLEAILKFRDTLAEAAEYQRFRISAAEESNSQPCD
jgi:hypothetical protein